MRTAILAVCSCFVVLVCAQSAEDVKGLLDVLKKNGINKSIRPLENQANVIQVKLGLYLTAIIDFDERKEALTTSLLLYVHWADEFRNWSANEYGGIDNIFVPQDEIWKPELGLKNSYKSFSGLGSSALKILVQKDGGVFWCPYQLIESQCSVNTRYFPFDTQTCSLIFNSGSYRDTELKLLIHDEIIFNLEEYSSNSLWDLISVSAGEYKQQRLSAVEFKLVLKRRPSYYVRNVLVPMLLLSFLGPFAFMLPAGSGERSGYAVTLYLALGVFLSVIASELPKNSEEVSVVSTYLVAILVSSSLILGICLVQGRLARKDSENYPPGCFPLLFYRISQAFRCKRSSGNPSWPELMDAVDFIMFWVFMTSTATCTIIAYVMAYKG